MKESILSVTPVYLPYTYVREAGHKVCHIAITYEIRPLCSCICASPAQQKKAGDTLCRCYCHAKGPKHTRALCRKEPDRCWTVLSQPSGHVCQTCHAESCKGPPPPPPPPPVLCKVPCPFFRNGTTICMLDEKHIGLHVAKRGAGKVSW